MTNKELIMKMSREDYQELQRMLKDTMSRQPENMNTWEKVKNYYIEKKLGKDHEKRARWDLLWATTVYSTRSFFISQHNKGLNDDHIDTALKRAVLELN